MADVKWKLDKSNEVAFKVDISSSEPVSGTPVARLVCETQGLYYAFPGKFSADEVEITIPPMEGKLIEGEYKAKLEVILEDKYFVPLEFDVEFGVTTKVMAEMVQKEEKIIEEPKPVRASLVSKPKSRPIKESVKVVKKKAEHKKPIRLKSLKERFGNE